MIDACRRGGGIAARRATGSCMLPYFSGERTPIHDPHAKGVLFGLNLTHTRGDIYRALLEGIAYGTNHIFETYLEAGRTAAPGLRGRRRHEEHGLGAGDLRRVGPRADRSAAARSARPTATRFSPRSAVGDVQREDIRTWNPVASEIEPNPAEVYGRQYRVFRELYSRNKDLMRQVEG